MDRTRIYCDIDDERDRQDARFGNQMHSWPIWAAILSEETGEVSEACLQAYWQEEGCLAHLREELVQVAAVAVQMLEKLDSGDYVPGPASRDETAVGVDPVSTRSTGGR
jgi:NTP pyrophosphatase (non-canonical NTP hydrolase)